MILEVVWFYPPWRFVPLCSTRNSRLTFAQHDARACKATWNGSWLRNSNFGVENDIVSQAHLRKFEREGLDESNTLGRERNGVRLNVRVVEGLRKLVP